LETADLLEAMGCDEIQGFWLAQPMPAENLFDWLRQHSWFPSRLTA